MSLGEQVSNGAWRVRIYHKAFVVWLWGGAILILLGGVLAMSDKRYRVMARKDARQKVAVADKNPELAAEKV